MGYSIVISIYVVLLAGLSDGRRNIFNFSSKTVYHFEEDQDSTNTPAHCKTIHVNLLARHGTRYPSKKDVKKINTMVHLVNDLQKAGVDFKFDGVEFPWTNPFTDHHDKSLTDRGEQELYNLSKRMRNRYPDLLDSPLSAEQFRFISTNTSRCLKSAMSFALGFLEGTGKLGACGMRPVEIESKSIDSDSTLRFFDHCSKYKNKVSKNKTSLHEHHNFKGTDQMMEIVEYVRLQFGNSSELRVKHVIGMFIACAFEVAVFDKENTWCNVFRPDDLKVFEYFYDLKHFWKRGYGYNINYKMSCTLLSAILTDIQNAADTSNTQQKRGMFRFAHAETLQPLYCLLGLFKDTDLLKANNYIYQVHRLYRTSKIVPFGANIAFVLYNCSNSEPEKPGYNFQLEILVNELPVAIPCCGTELKCSLEKFVDCFNEVVNNCDLKRDCSDTQPQQNVEQEIHDEL